MAKLATQIHPRVFQVAAPFEGGGLVNCYLIDAPRRTLIDTGTASVPQASLLPALKEMGWDLADLRVIINTHLHIDHAGGNAEMQEASGAGIHIHKADAEFTDRERYIEKYCRDALRLMGDDDQIPQSEAFQRQLLGREWGVERALEDGDEIDLGGDVRLHVLHTPGHTPGSASFYWESESLVFSGDAVGGRGSRAGGFPLYFAAADYAELAAPSARPERGDPGPGAPLPLVGADPGGSPHGSRGAPNARRVPGRVAGHRHRRALQARARSWRRLSRPGRARDPSYGYRSRQ